MDTPDVTKIQGTTLGGFAAIVIGAPAAGYEGQNLTVLIIASALLGAAITLSDAIIRHGRAGILSAEMQGLQGNLALTGAYTEDVQNSRGGE